ncbi:hypothetical protein PISMIDRAFT_643273 [Pisolithus microcarpus 441]|uniref:Uncharacterized protein n=1 Tax=Pisolithus microcarpus 441 TaxID=765257 RepID=A0A0C9ZS92_9AGAM|nr:hypothetical protein PISMIDRAFT_643273 [Pisolithus microcarpus 441]
MWIHSTSGLPVAIQVIMWLMFTSLCALSPPRGSSLPGMITPLFTFSILMWSHNSEPTWIQ